MDAFFDLWFLAAAGALIWLVAKGLIGYGKQEARQEARQEQSVAAVERTSSKELPDEYERLAAERSAKHKKAVADRKARVREMEQEGDERAVAEGRLTQEEMDLFRELEDKDWHRTQEEADLHRELAYKRYPAAD